MDSIKKICTDENNCGLDVPSALCVDCHCASNLLDNKRPEWKSISVHIVDGHVEVWIHSEGEHRLMIQDYYCDGGVVSHHANITYWKDKPVKGRWND